MDELTVWTLFVVVGLTALTVLLTGPGLWSEKWGWWWLKDRRRVRDQRKDDDEP